MHKTIRMFWLGLLFVFIAGCSGKPSTSDIQDALQTHYRQQLQQAEDQARALGGDAGVNMMHAFGSPKPEDLTISDVEILDSKTLENGDYEMRIRFTTLVDDKSKMATRKILMLQTDDGWRAQEPD